MKHLACIAASAAALAFASTAKADDPVVYKFSFASPPTSWINTKGIMPWAEQVAAASGGDLKI